MGGGLKPIIANKLYSAHVTKRATSPFVHHVKLSLNFSSSSFVIRVNLLHP